MTNTPRKRAPGGGRKPKPPGEKRIKVAITMRPDLYEETKGNRSRYIERALDYYEYNFPIVKLSKLGRPALTDLMED